MKKLFERWSSRENLFSQYGRELTGKTKKRIARQLIWYGEIRSVELLKEAITQDCSVLPLAPAQMISEEIAKYAVQCNRKSLTYLPLTHRDNPEINRIAMINPRDAVLAEVIKYYGNKLPRENQSQPEHEVLNIGEICSVDLLKQAIAQDCGVLNLLPPDLISEEIAKYAVQCDGRSLRHLPQKFLDNPEINRIAISQTPEALRWASSEFRNMPELMFPVASEYGMLEIASAELQDNSDFVYLACKDEHFERMRFASDRIKCNAEFILTVLKPKELANLSSVPLNEGLLRLATSRKNNMSSSAYIHKLTAEQVFPHVPSAELEATADRVNSLILSASNFGYQTFRDSEALAKAICHLELNYPDFTHDQIERAIVFDWCVAYRL